MALFGNARKYREFEPIRSNADSDIRFEIKIRDEEIVRLKEEIKKLKEEIKRLRKEADEAFNDGMKFTG